MPATVTQREVPARTNGAVPKLDSPAVSARARARIPVTESVDKISDATGSIKTAAAGWWGFTARPLSLRDLWRSSAVDAKRIPGKSGGLAIAWQVSNWADRLVMFAFIAVLPTFATGPLRWCAARPTRRWAFYLVTAVLAATYALGRG
jgi:hypothetical protein